MTGAAAARPAGATGWLFRPVPLARLAWLRTLVYLFVPVDVLLTTPWVATHDTAPAALYRPLLLERLTGIPAPGGTLVHAVEVLLLLAAVVAASGRAPRLLGAAVAVLYLEWMLIAMSYGKVDHDRFAFLVALAVLPTVGRAGHRNRTGDEAAGFAVRCVQLAVVATYLLSVVAKARFGGSLLRWLDSAVFVRAVLRRGTVLATPLLHHVQLLTLGQWLLVAVELGSPLLLLLTGRWLYAVLGGYLAFHVMTWAAISIVFLPHLVCLLAFLPLEGLTPALTRRPAHAVRLTPGGGSAAGSAHAGVPPGSRLRLSATRR